MDPLAECGPAAIAGGGVEVRVRLSLLTFDFHRASQQTPSKYNPIATFEKAFSVFKKKNKTPTTESPLPTFTSKPPPSTTLALSLDPGLQQAIGHVPETKSKKQPLEKDENAPEEEEFAVSDISDSVESEDAPIVPDAPLSIPAAPSSMPASSDAPLTIPEAPAVSKTKYVKTKSLITYLLDMSLKSKPFQLMMAVTRKISRNCSATLPPISKRIPEPPLRNQRKPYMTKTLTTKILKSPTCNSRI